ncbi:MAG: DNA polymerase III subunit delta [Bacilli bacterium]|nr:DNA polymerase III subunit delta [Bacilli bacterium]
MENIYLISSSSYRLMEEEIHKIVKDHIYTSFDLNYQSIEEVLDEANYFSLFDEEKYLVIKNANIFSASRKKETDDEEKTSKKDDKLINYLENPNPKTILIFTTYNKPAGNKKIVKIIQDRYKLIRIEDLKISDIQLKLDKLFKEDGYKCNKDTIYYIINNSLNNYDLSYNEVEKIKLYYGKACEVKQEDVKEIISRAIEDNNFKFLDAVVGRKIKDAFVIYDDLMRQKVEPIMLLSMLAKEYRNMLLIKKCKSYSKNDLMSLLELRYDFQLDKSSTNSYNYTVESLEDILVYLADLDYKIKNGKITNKRALELFILYVCK